MKDYKYDPFQLDGLLKEYGKSTKNYFLIKELIHDLKLAHEEIAEQNIYISELLELDD